MMARVFVTLRREVLDPQGAAVQRGLQRLGFESVADVRVGKYLEIQLGDVKNRAAAEAQVRAMCEKMLVNPVMEEFSFELEAADAGTSEA